MSDDKGNVGKSGLGKTDLGNTGLYGEIGDAELEEVLGNFKASVHAWSEAAYSRPRTVAAVRRWSWRLAGGWALGCVVVAGTLTGGLHERQLRREQGQEQARIAAAEQAKQKQLAVEKNSAAEDSDLLATVDTDVSQEVPSAMEPLARLMDEDTNQ